MRALMVLLACLAAVPLVAQQDEPEIFGETIFVVRYTLDVRVTDRRGRAIDDLTADDFMVKVGGKEAHVESASWVAEGHRAKLAEALAPEQLDDPALEFEAHQPDTRSIIILVQTDFARVSDRVLGQMRFNYVADDIIALFGPNDRVAVLSHDSHLKFRRDFTRDQALIRKAVRDSLFLDNPPVPPATTDGPSLLPLLDPVEMKRAPHAEAALLLIAKAFHQIEGPKLIILAGWGVGELQGRAGVLLKDEWKEAVAILRRDSVPVISLNHGLEGELAAGLQATAAATGGFYAGLKNFPEQSVTRMEGALAGHYALLLRIDDPLKPGQHPLTVRTKRKGAEVQAPVFVIHGQ
jgi:hypothetical protein